MKINMLKSPFLKKISLSLKEFDRTDYPFCLPLFESSSDESEWELEFDKPVTFFVGENGSGKSTLVEAIAAKCGFNLQGGNRNHLYDSQNQISCLAACLRAGWLPKVNKGFFLRGESFFNFASYLDRSSRDDAEFLSPYGGKSLHKQSHGESFMALFKNKFGGNQKEIYLLDEPESALSPKRQIDFLRILSELSQTGRYQFIIATHSPILMSLPGASVLSFTDSGIVPTHFMDTEHFQVTKEFLTYPESFLADL